MKNKRTYKSNYRPAGMTSCIDRWEWTPSKGLYSIDKDELKSKSDYFLKDFLASEYKPFLIS